MQQFSLQYLVLFKNYIYLNLKVILSVQVIEVKF